MGHRHTWAALAAATSLLALTSCGDADGSAADDASPSVTVAAPTAAGPDCPDAGEPWEVAKVYIEHNATDEDTGFHGFFGGEPWRSLCVRDPDGRLVWELNPADRLQALGVSDLFFESNEPPNAEYSPDQLGADFPEGPYAVAGVGVDSVARVGQARFTHAIPAAPEILGPPLAGDEEAADAASPVPPDGVVVRWRPVDRTIDGAPVTITGYQVIVTDEEVEDPDGFARPVHDVHVRPDVTELALPAGFLEADHLYELEVLAIEESGNQTISVGFFRTA